MISGIVTAQNEPIISLKIFDNNEQEHDFDAIIDTGYTGWLTLSIEKITAFGLKWHRRGRATLANGQEVLFNV